MPTARFSFPTQVDFGPDALARLPEHITKLGHHALIVTDPVMATLPPFARLLAVLKTAKTDFTVYTQVSPNPTASECEQGGRLLKEAHCDVVVGFGGGSALDAAKGIALMERHAPPIVRYDDAKGGDAYVTEAVAPIIAIPTTAGTGSEVGRSTVVVDETLHRKIVVFAPSLMPTLALVDPTLMISMPAWLTAATGFDALTHNLEALLAKGYHPMADGIAMEGIRLVLKHLPTAYHEPDNIPAREGMAMAALMGATAFQKGLGAAHSMAHPLGALTGLHHGLANAILLPYILRFNAPVCAPLYQRVERLCDLEGGLLEHIESLAAELGIPSTLTEAGVDHGLIDALSEEALADACHHSNPVTCTLESFKALFEQAFTQE